jgi:hypothetical protein
MEKEWLAILTCLMDIFEKLNDFSLSLQGHNTNILIHSYEVKAFTTKTGLLLNKLVTGIYEIFPCFSKTIIEIKVALNQVRV